ncbi:MAG: PIN domain-containing protein [Balneolaceae bacterium]
MKVLFDTNAVIALIISVHPHHSAINRTYKKLKSQKAELYIANHTIAELYRNLTRGQHYLSYSPKQAKEIIHATVLTEFELTKLNNSHYVEVIDWVSSLNLSGAIVYDALISKAASLIKATYLVTFNAKDFQRVFPENGADLIIPG